MVLAPDADGRQRHVRKLDEKLVKREELLPGPRPGKEMVVIGGRHQDLHCLVLEVLPKEEGRSG
jgi:G patch domain/KOW motif-containing protein